MYRAPWEIYTIHGRRIDLLYVVDGVRFIVELKGIPLQREHIGQIVEYYGLMKSYLQEANLRMIVVAPSIPEWRGKYLEELGIRCVELPEVPVDPLSASRVTDNSRKNIRRETEALKRDSQKVSCSHLTERYHAQIHTSRSPQNKRRILFRAS